MAIYGKLLRDECFSRLDNKGWETYLMAALFQYLVVIVGVIIELAIAEALRQHTFKVITL